MRTREDGRDPRRELRSLARSALPIAWNAALPMPVRAALLPLVVAMAAAVLLWTPVGPGTNPPPGASTGVQSIRKSSPSLRPACRLKTGPLLPRRSPPECVARRALA